MYKFVFTFSICFWIYSCNSYKNETCKPSYIGTFLIDTNLVTNKIIKRQIIANHWDTVKLISGSNGKYFFRSDDLQLRSCEGKWYVKSNDLEGNCFGYVKQNNMNSTFISMPFDIWIIIDNETFTLPFRKVSNVSN
jgi:hypothetical protein